MRAGEAADRVVSRAPGADLMEAGLDLEVETRAAVD